MMENTIRIEVNQALIAWSFLDSLKSAVFRLAYQFVFFSQLKYQIFLAKLNELCHSNP